MHDQRARLSQRIRLFAQLEASAVVIITVAGVLILPAKWFPIVSASLLTLLFSGMLYALRNSRYAELAVYINLVAVILITAALGPATRQLTGVSWVLFQAWPPIAALILRQARASLIVAVIAAVCMVLVFLLQLEGVLPGEQLVPERILWLTLMFQLVVLGLLSTVTMFVSKGENQALKEALEARQQLEAQLRRVEQLIADKDQLNRDLEASLAAVRAQEEQIRHEQHEQQQLRQTILELSAPVLPVLEKVVVMPLVGSFSAERAEEMVTALLNGIERHRARVVVLDVTGVQVIDTAVAHVIVEAAGASRLLGTTPVLVGIGPEIAQTLVGLGVDLRTIETKADLKAGVEYAMQLLEKLR